MQNNDFNPYSPPAHETATSVASLFSTGQDYRIEKNVMILPPPFHLPTVCFLTGAREGLRRCEIPLKVMPKWWHNFIPVVMFAMQALAFCIGIVIQKFKLILPAWLSSPAVGFIASAVVLLTFATVFFGIFWGTKKNFTLVGFWTNSESVFRRRRQAVLLVLIIDIILVSGLLMTWLLFDGSLPLVGITLTVMPLAFVLTWIVWLRNRKPWSRIGALQQADGSLAVYGLDPSFLAVCRLGLDDAAAPRIQRTIA
jgi:hypothetical protein